MELLRLIVYIFTYGHFYETNPMKLTICIRPGLRRRFGYAPFDDRANGFTVGIRVDGGLVSLAGPDFPRYVTSESGA